MNEPNFELQTHFGGRLKPGAFVRREWERARRRPFPNFYSAPAGMGLRVRWRRTVQHPAPMSNRSAVA
jgi:hypothetical protein